MNIIIEFYMELLKGFIFFSIVKMITDLLTEGK